MAASAVAMRARATANAAFAPSLSKTGPTSAVATRIPTSGNEPRLPERASPNLRVGRREPISSRTMPNTNMQALIVIRRLVRRMVPSFLLRNVMAHSEMLWQFFSAVGTANDHDSDHSVCSEIEGHLCHTQQRCLRAQTRTYNPNLLGRQRLSPLSHCLARGS